MIMRVTKKAFMAVCFFSVFSMFGCSGNRSVSQSDGVAETTNPEIKVYYEILVTASTENVTEMVALTTKPFVPDIKQNLSDDVDLSLVVVNNFEIDIDDISLDAFLKMTGIKRSSAGHTLIDTNTFYFEGAMYSLDEANGTQVSVEVIDKDGNYVEFGAHKNYNPAELRVKGISSSASWTRDDFKVRHAGSVCVGMEKDVLTAIMGSGTVIDGKNIYKNSSYTMVVSFAYKSDEAGNTIPLVDQITVVKN